MKKRMIALLAGAILCLNFAACAKPAEETGSAADKSAESSVTASKTEESAPEESKQESAPTSQTSEETDLAALYQITDDDPHKSDKETILAAMKQLLNSEEFQQSPLSRQPAFFTSNLNPLLKEKEIDFDYNCQYYGMYGTFSDGERWGFKYDGLITERPEETMAKRSADEAENQKLDRILDLIKTEMREDGYRNLGKESQIQNLMQLNARYTMENMEDHLPFTVSLTGINGTFADGTKWGYTFEELEAMAVSDNP